MASARVPLMLRVSTWISYFWLALFFLVPFVIVLKMSISEKAIAIPPYLPAFSGLNQLSENIGQFSAINYARLIEDALYFNAYISSITIAFIATLITLIIGYPIAYAMARAPGRLQAILMIMMILPFWTSFLIRVYAWIGILKPEGLLNQFLMWTGLIGSPLAILNTDLAVYIGIVYSYLPFMVLPLYAALERMDRSLLEAAADLGAPPIKRFWQITLPLSLPGIAAGSLLVFIPAVGEFVIPDLLGGSRTLMIGKTLWDEFFRNGDWPAASAVAIILLLLLVVPIVLFQNTQAKLRETNA